MLLSEFEHAFLSRIGKSNLNNASHCIFMSFDAISGFVGFCGTICSDCSAFKTTLGNDDAERGRGAELFTRQYGQGYEAVDIDCDGCASDGERIFSYCGSGDVDVIRDKELRLLRRVPLREAERDI